jgi:hypothetical protein
MFARNLQAFLNKQKRRPSDYKIAVKIIGKIKKGPHYSKQCCGYGSRIRIRMFLGLPDPLSDPLITSTDTAPDPSIIKQK